VAVDRSQAGAGRGGATVLVVASEGTFETVEGLLLSDGIAALRVRTLAELRTLLRVYADRSVAMLDVEDSVLGVAALEALHQPPAVPTLMLMGVDGFKQFGAGYFSPERRDELAFKPLNDDEVVLRVKALLVRAGFALPEGEPNAPPSAPSRAVPGGRSLLVFGAKGGVGKTTLAVNLAVTLARKYGKRVVLIDGDLWFGDVAVLMNLSSARSISDLPDDLDSEMLTKALVRHGSGVLVLLPPPEAGMVEKIPEDRLAKVVEQAKSIVDYVVVDTHTSFGEANLQLLEEADTIVLVSTPELSAVRNASRVLTVAHALGLDHKIRLVINRANSGLEIGALEKSLKFPVAATVVSAGRVVVPAANDGVPMVDRDPEAGQQVTRDVLNVSSVVTGLAPPEPRPRPRGGFFSWSKRGE